MTLRLTLGFVLAAVVCGPATATVFINEVFINPPGSLDDTREFIELFGTPGKKLDGYAIALANGTQQKYYPLGSIPPAPNPPPEIDELFSLDGLALGANGILVIGIGVQSNYSTLLADSNFQRWNTIYNGGLDTPGNLQNDGSNTVLLIRQRPGRTQSDPLNPAGLRWGKDIPIDAQLFTPVVDPQSGQNVDQFGDGEIDSGEPRGYGGNTLDLLGATTPSVLFDDLEIVDEVSYEHDRGWEYDFDRRRVDTGSLNPALPPRRVHALDDPQGFNPDVLTRVDYRTKGPGWPPATGGVGELPNGNNWQDTATEQWIRGENVQAASGGQGLSPFFFYSIVAYSDPNNPGVQPYETNVPTWLADGVAPDFDFTTANTYQIMAGRVNPLAVPFIPGDVDRDGDCDAEDIDIIRSVFGRPDVERDGSNKIVYQWVHANADPNSPLSAADPATQIRPWDVNATGDNGIEPSDLQWTLNFQGNTNGRIIGRRYDSTTPSATGVVLAPNTGVNCTVTAQPSATSAEVGQIIQVEVRGQVTGGANLGIGLENGIMQFIHDLALTSPGVFRVVQITPVGGFQSTNADEQFQAPLGVAGDLGVRNVNGFTTSFTVGLTGPAPLYTVSLLAVGEGSTTLTLGPAQMPRILASTPRGLKVGHTASNGDPATATYPAGIVLSATAPSLCPGDVNCSGAVDFDDIDLFVEALGYPGGAGWPYPDCPWLSADCDGNGNVDFDDIDPFVALIGTACP